MTEFWVSSGHHLTNRTAHGALAVTDELLLALLAREELLPPFEACLQEKALHAALLQNPRTPLTKAMIDGIKDADARENWHYMAQFRDLLLTHKTIEAAYLALMRSTKSLPLIFVHQLVHLMMRNMLDGEEDVFLLRAGELFFRQQKGSLSEGALLLADNEIIEHFEAENKSLMASSPLTAMLGKDVVKQLDILNEETKHSYWSRSDAFTMVMPYGADPKMRQAFARIIEKWLQHLLALETHVTPLTQLKTPAFKWFVGLTQEGTAMGNALFRGEESDATAQSRLIGIYELQIKTQARVQPAMRGEPIYLFLSLDEGMMLRLKPQNLIVNLPLLKPQ